MLRELKATRFTWEGRDTTLLDELGLVSGVSGGSIPAAHYAMFGDETLSRFEPDFLLKSFETDLVHGVLAPSRLPDLTSPWYGRSNVLDERLNVLYRGHTFGDLAARAGGPRLLASRRFTLMTWISASAGKPPPGRPPPSRSPPATCSCCRTRRARPCIACRHSRNCEKVWARQCCQMTDNVTWALPKGV